MKKSMIFVGLLAIGFANAQEYDGKVGINTNEPKATLDITPEATNLNGTTNEGILVPRLSKERVAKMATPETSTLVYVNNITYTASNTATPADTRVALVDAVGYYQYNGTQWERIGGEPWKVYGTDKYATQNNQNIYQKGNVVASALNIPTNFLNMGETSQETTAWGMKSNIRGFSTYGEETAVNGTFFAKHYGSLSGSHLSLSSRGKNNGGSIAARARIELNVGPEDATKPYSSFYIYKYGGDKTTGGEVSGTYLINKALEGGSNLHFTEDGSFLFMNSANGKKYFTNAEGTVMQIYKDGNVGIGTVADAPSNKLHVKATADPLRLEGLQASTTATDKILVTDTNGVVKTIEQSGLVATNPTVKATASEDTCTSANAGTFHYKERAVNGQQVGTMGFCTRQNGNYIWVYFSNGANVLQSAGTNKFGEGL